MKSQRHYPQAYSFEFFPPKTTEGTARLTATSEALAALNPCFFSVTYGAGGTTRERTFAAVSELRQRTGIDVAPHLSCIGSSRDGIREILKQYMDQGIRHIVALRGDMPSGMRDAGEFHYANELVEFIRAETSDHYFIEVAAYTEFHPQAPSARVDLQNFKRKVEAGADAALTQYFYNADAYFRFIDSCEQMGLDLPVVPGIMPITNYVQLARFSDGCGAEIPRWLRKRLEDFGDDLASLRDFGADVVAALCQRLLESGSPGLHFYTMNQAEPTLAVWKRLNIESKKPSGDR